MVYRRGGVFPFIGGEMSDLARCIFCYGFFVVPKVFRYPSDGCSCCSLKIQAAAKIPALPEPDWGEWAKKQPGYFEADGWVIQ